MSLFSVFDPVGIFNLSVNWTVIFVVVILYPVCFNMVGSWMWVVSGVLFSMVGSEYSDTSGDNYIGVMSISLILLIYLVFINVMGLFPFVFTSSSHLMFTFSLGMMMWFSFFLMGWFKKFEMSSSHLVPEGSPLVLAPFMVVVEMISHIIRPITLSVRLAANMMAGHMIIGLIALVSDLSVGGFVFSVFFQWVMLVLEWAVSLIQAFVFSMLVMLYYLEYI